MRQSIKLLLIAWIILVGNAPARATETTDINTILMRSTFKIEGPASPGRTSVGTVFIVGRPVPGDTQRLFLVLVTAAHVLRGINGEQATLFLRKKQGDEFAKLPYQLQIRNGTSPLWKEHPRADVAAMYVRLPQEADVQPLPTSLLASDQELDKREIHPGDVLSCLGYPYGAEANEAGFPILRSGQIASYPLTPTSKIPTFLMDFRVLGGNSGGPVYFVASNRTYGGSTMLGETIHFLAGLVSGERVITKEINSPGETLVATYSLSLAVVVHAALIRETMELLPLHPEQ